MYVYVYIGAWRDGQEETQLSRWHMRKDVQHEEIQQGKAHR